eukprot:3059566-Prymnesium_polylepis.1
MGHVAFPVSRSTGSVSRLSTTRKGPCVGALKTTSYAPAPEYSMGTVSSLVRDATKDEAKNLLGSDWLGSW